jgi:cellulose synthase/poly-beta-1,6-N-acetylglucosamine synthase-like glycosyltransferase
LDLAFCLLDRLDVALDEPKFAAVTFNGILAWPLLGGALALDGLLTLVPLFAALRARKQTTDRVANRQCTVVIPAHNEAAHLGATVARICEEVDLELTVIIVDDGSTDRTLAVARELAAVDTRIHVQSVSRGGKANALNTALALTTTERFVTIDADTHIERGALRSLLREFDDETVDAVSGFIVAKATAERSLLGSFQRLEYLRASALRTGLSNLWMHEQAPGAFTAFRTESLKRAGGFPDSLTEDYEVIFRLYDLARKEGRRVRILSSKAAIAKTSPVQSVSGLFEQRTRWFAGFLVTLWRYRSMCFDRRLGLFGLVRIPHKVLDAAMPLIVVMATLTSVVTSVTIGHWPEIAPPLFVLPMLFSLVATALAHRLVASLRWSEWLLLPFEPLYALLRTAAILRAYPRAFAKTRSQWKPVR